MAAAARSCRLRRHLAVAAGLALVATAQPARSDELGAAVIGIDPTFAPFFGGRSPGVVVQRTRRPHTDTIRWVTSRESIARVATLDHGRRLVQLDHFGRKVDHELRAALVAADEVILDLRRNRGGIVRRMLRVAARFTGPVPDAMRLVRDDGAVAFAIPAPIGPVWRGRITVLVGGLTISSGEVLAALLRRYAGARVLGEATYGKVHVMRVERIDADWQALVPDGRLEVPGEPLAGGLTPDGPIPPALLARVGDGLDREAGP